MAVSAAGGSPTLAYPGPFTVAPANGVAGNAFTVPNPVAADPATVPAAPTTGSGSGTNVYPPLAVAGAETPVLATLSLLLMGIGGVLLVAARREDESTR